MMRLFKTTRVLAGLALSLFLLAACTTPTVVIPPTPDLSVVRTEAAQTVVAKVTIAAALNPTATQAPTLEPQVVVITATQAANPTAAPATATSAAVQAPTATTAATQPPAPSTSSGGGIYPTRTPRTLPDNLSLISFSPADGASFTPGAEFDAVWTVKNTGTTTWGTDYYVRFKSGTDMGKAVRFYLKEPVAPGETANLVADLVAPSASGTYLSYYEFCTNNADIIYTMYVMITVP